LMDLYFNKPLVKAIHLAVAYLHGDVDIVQVSLRCAELNSSLRMRILTGTD
jgi:hypothetical protein